MEEKSNVTPTAEKFLLLYPDEYYPGEVFGEFAYKANVVYEAMVEFAKLHVKAALEAAARKAQGYHGAGDSNVDKDSILNAYPLENIK